ncbi:diguanylate cyclase [Paenalkalicoccus suaedae]|uniref:Diguanylate cyclase n=1 Tax=Paenalkalicoccus suaedae TaxID=2592382 RepID=A0A859FC31_9BACI|nr:HD domain-containing phosphohydrolase [Paenalkalicoccus suaedae]QKS69786.1 diguanylate cyclase [Paenalkalicoccus suaedae]
MKSIEEMIDRVLLEVDGDVRDRKRSLMESVAAYVNGTVGREYKEFFEVLFTRSPVATLLVTIDGTISKGNMMAKDLLLADELIGLSFYAFFPPVIQSKLAHFLQETVSSEQKQTLEVDTVGDDPKHLRLFSQHVPGSDSQPMIQLVLLDETQAYLTKNQAEYLSFHDQMTGLYNRRFFEEELRRLDVKRMLPLGIIMGDVNGLKMVNDTFGHSAGDELIKEVANRLKRMSRDEDILCRLAGDEFVLLLPNTPPKELKRIMYRMDAICDDIIMHDIHLSVAFGYGAKMEDTTDMSEVLREAENAMYKNKLYKKSSRRHDLINGMIATLYEKHPREKHHSERVSELAVALGRAAGLDELAIQRIRTASLLHDIGKIAIDQSILDKETPLTPEEDAELRKHPEVGYRILNAAADFDDIADIVVAHHEREDGSGYPRGLTGDDMRMESKILALCNEFDAMTSTCPRRELLPINEAILQLENRAGTHFDERLVRLLVEVVL